MTPRATFVIPAYNADRWISKTIWSCRNQTVKQIEIIVINDASTDGTLDILDWHAKEDARIKVIHLSENKGQVNARNMGNQLAQADHIFVLDADDMATRNRVKDTLVAFQLKGCDLVHGSFFIVDSMGIVQTKSVAIKFDPERAKQLKTNHICHSTVAYTKKVALDVPYTWENYGPLGIDDWRFEWDVWNKGYKFYALKSPLSYYRATEGSMTIVRNSEKMNQFKDEFLATF